MRTKMMVVKQTAAYSQYVPLSPMVLQRFGNVLTAKKSSKLDKPKMIE